MTAQEHLNSRQFNLFKQVPGGTVQVPLWAHAHDITNHPNVDYLDSDGDIDELRYYKLIESQHELHNPVTGESLYESIQNEGIHKPVTLEVSGRSKHNLAPHLPELFVRGGHHRLFSAEDLDEQRDGAGGRINRVMVPLRYDDKTERFHGSW